jgi:hypothetical protein
MPSHELVTGPHDRAPDRAFPRPSRAPGMHAGHDLLLALTLAVALGATLCLYAR